MANSIGKACEEAIFSKESGVKIFTSDHPADSAGFERRGIFNKAYFKFKGVHPDARNPDVDYSTEACVIFRGMLNSQFLQLARANRITFKGYYLIAVVWANTESALVAELNTVFDEVIVLDAPTIDNRGNVNKQISMASIGLKRAVDLKFKYTLLARWDFYFDDPSILNRAKSQVLVSGNSRKIIVSDIFTSKYSWDIHPADLIMFGEVETLKSYWTVPAVDAESPIVMEIQLGLGLKARSEDFKTYYAAEEERANANALILADHYIVKEFEWFNAGWYKYPVLDPLTKGILELKCFTSRDMEHVLNKTDPDGVKGSFFWELQSYFRQGQWARTGDRPLFSNVPDDTWRNYSPSRQASKNQVSKISEVRISLFKRWFKSIFHGPKGLAT
ncbi:hypothetical protein AEYBE204_00020 [Asticcacaulis sp. YBE204]|nr:hypothetical protein AEYBE204_00020 [Asticcacaulis sp. YBE204]